MIKTWNLGSPINVRAFLERADIPNGAKQRVEAVGEAIDKVYPSDKERAELHKLMQAQIILEVAEVAALEKERRQP